MECTRLYDKLEARPPSSDEMLSPSFTFLECSDTEEAAGLREMLQEWFCSYSGHDKGRLKGRLRDPSEHDSAALELCFHEVLFRAGYKMIPHPLLNGSGSHLDFLCYREGVRSLYVEVYQRRGTDIWREEQHDIKLLAHHIDKRFGSGDFMIHLLFEKYGSLVSLENFDEWLDAFVHEHDVDEVEAIERERGARAIPTRHYVDGSCDIVISLISRSPELRAQPGSVAVPSIDIGGWLIDLSRSTRDHMLDKCVEYNISDLPFVFVLGVQDPRVQSDTIQDILFGDRHFPEPNGLFQLRPEVSAVVAVRDFDLRGLRRSQAQLIHNPWARRPYEGPLCRLEQVRVENGCWQGLPGLSLAEALGLD